MELAGRRPWLGPLPPVLICLAGVLAAQTRLVVQLGQETPSFPAGLIGEPLTVTVTDGSGQPVAGAKVSIALPDTGPSGVFPGGVKSLTVVTDAKGVATLADFHANLETGPFKLTTITAQYGQASERVTFQPRNVAVKELTLKVEEGSGTANVKNKTERMQPRTLRVLVSCRTADGAVRVARGARVRFVLPPAKKQAGGYFTGSAPDVFSDAEGRAATSVRLNEIAGDFYISVEAAVPGLERSNIRKGGCGTGCKVALVVLIGGAGGGAAAVLGRKGGGNGGTTSPPITTPPATTISIPGGGVVIGPP
jgi:hypothetical protein